MSIDSIATKAIGGILLVAALTTFFGRRNTASVVDSLGRAFSGSISAALGKGVSLG